MLLIEKKEILNVSLKNSNEISTTTLPNNYTLIKKYIINSPDDTY